MLDQKLIREKFLEFFKTKEHVVISSASLIPENDPTVLFNTAGMQPLIPYLMGEKHPQGTRLVNSQKCVRVVDIEEVGDDTHYTFFEMLGNWSLGDYFKKETIRWSFEFLTDEKWLNLDPNKIYISVFAGDKSAPRDKEAISLWKEEFAKKGININCFGENHNFDKNTKIFALGVEDNWWSPGPVGPCGTDTEIFYYTGEGTPDLTKERPGFNDNNFMEIWNNVFMQYYRNGKGELTELKNKNIDTGMGFERIVRLLSGTMDVYQSYLFKDSITILEELSGKKYGEAKETTRLMRIVADHLRTVTFILADDAKVVPSNVDQGYLIRRLLRRALVFVSKLGVDNNKNLGTLLAKSVIKTYKDTYDELDRNRDFVFSEIQKEEEKFKKTLQQGLKEFNRVLDNLQGNVISGKDVFILFSTYGFPVEMTKEFALERYLSIDEKGFKEEFKKHQELSRLGAEKRFKGGLAGNSDIHKKYHTATHLLHQALRLVLGDHVQQKGSNITEARLRFDFVHNEKMTKEQLKEVEDLVNKQIEDDLEVSFKETNVDDAKKDGAIGLFDHKYEDLVKVYTIGKNESYFSKEICGGPHVARLSELGYLKIKKEESSSAGIRRIKAVLE